MVKVILAYLLPVLLCALILLWQREVDIQFNAIRDNLTWEQKMTYLRHRHWRMLAASLIMALYLTTAYSGVFDLIGR